VICPPHSPHSTRMCLFRRMLHHAMPCHAMPCYTVHAVPCRAVPYHAMPCYTMPCHVIPCYTVHAIPCHAMLYRACHAVPFHTMPCHARATPLTPHGQVRTPHEPALQLTRDVVLAGAPTLLAASESVRLDAGGGGYLCNSGTCVGAGAGAGAGAPWAAWSQAYTAQVGMRADWAGCTTCHHLGASRWSIRSAVDVRECCEGRTGAARECSCPGAPHAKEGQAEERHGSDEHRYR
jgi:hypothetical protein